MHFEPDLDAGPKGVWKSLDRGPYRAALARPRLPPLLI